ncbi:sulfatase-like hydrolase/transferase [Skermania sp. ID1734]|uniref:sulfatase-like hydrolase/transferase n=1 Tax=Skermania sp. ID1734 TaxID=2597516 RepID=UPI00117C789F|nr:sulfatase-like hydrolase/transferase [Skermania sp. ID1734]TSD99197.1 sulfatase-like hydrolase/transferase [Skermania sp. ID1734]
MSGFGRRSFIGGAAGAAVLAGLGAAIGPQRAAAAGRSALPARPNILIIITDQERQPMYWPQGWSQRNLPNRQRLADTGLTFTRNFCNSAMCSPSRSTFFTGKYPAQHGVVSTLTTGGTVSPTEPQLPLTEQNMAKVLAAAGYNVHYRGKWHMSKGPDGAEPTPADLAAYGFQGWVPPEVAQDTEPAHFGGGCANLDTPIAEQSAEFLRTVDTSRPFALIVSFGNPHDILAYPKTWNASDGHCDNYGSAAPECFNQGIDLPPTFGESLLLNHKPTAQTESQVLLAGGLGPLLGPDAPRNYVNLYAYMHKVVDQHIGMVIDALESRPGLREDTLVFRISDHGEMGLSHGGLRQKIFNVYEETLRVPLVVSNPVLFPKPVETPALSSLIDVLPTLASISRTPGNWDFRGVDLTPVIDDAAAHPENPTARVRDAVMFTYDDQNCATPNGQAIVTGASHIRCVRDDRWKYAMYFDPAGIAPPQYEMYDLDNDPQEMNNRADPLNLGNYDSAQAGAMHTKLTSMMAATGTTPGQGAI